MLNRLYSVLSLSSIWPPAEHNCKNQGPQLEASRYELHNIHYYVLHIYLYYKLYTYVSRCGYKLALLIASAVCWVFISPLQDAAA